ncbi:hypothetical protein OQA88_5406 [Cercophora sp. LCS_1]
MADIETAAKATLATYAAAVAKGADPSVPRSEPVSFMAKFYLPGWTAFTLGGIKHFDDDSATLAAIEQAFVIYDSMGLGADIRLDSSRIEPISSSSAIVFVTWSLHTKDEVAWKFTVAYGFRLMPGRPDGLLGGWEWVNADQEFQQLLARNPKLFG